MKNLGLTKEERESVSNRYNSCFLYDSDIVIDLESKKVLKSCGHVKSTIFDNNLLYIKVKDKS